VACTLLIANIGDCRSARAAGVYRILKGARATMDSCIHSRF